MNDTTALNHQMLLARQMKGALSFSPAAFTSTDEHKKEWRSLEGEERDRAMREVDMTPPERNSFFATDPLTLWEGY